ncbi:hypothetical protein [Candidatus Entotheonella palauensis]|uniref:Transglutaminase-like domain-containing protein n=1 Tax=Candidatus Entotheonella gemina TaxID=1429439 RepID=W4LQM5_9BACT|nr:hypothetical protein [Candidatus Entotheonella palauensis]ETX00036.1 MAG: hypothetical protein ETSY2_39810 [Candidatus Entotheonella gemina]
MNQIMHTFEVLPEWPLHPCGEITAQFLALGLTDFRRAAAYLNQLPYGRNTYREDGRGVLQEGRGTCSTKHAMLAALAQEQEMGEVVLILGLFEMTERNTPGVGAVLAQHGLPCMPEAHCYLRYREMRVDITRSGQAPSEPIAQLMHETQIAPGQIGSYKTVWHQRFIQEWVRTPEIAGGLGWEEVWRIREACIAALSQ